MRWLGWILAAGASLYFVLFALDTVSSVDWRTLNFARTFTWLGLAAALMVLSIPVASWAWGRLLASVGVFIPAAKLNAIMGISQFAKYAPGNIGQHIGRVLLANGYGIPGTVLAVTMIAEALLTICAGMLIALICIFAMAGTSEAFPLSASSLGVLLAAAVCGLVLGLPYLERLIPYFQQKTRIGSAVGPTKLPGLSAYATALTTYLANFVIGGTALFVVSYGVVPASVTLLPMFIGTFAVAWVAGFLAPGAPAGLGVREGVMVAILGSELDQAVVLQIAVAFRLATVLGDVLALAAGVGLRHLTAAGTSRSDVQ